MAVNSTQGEETGSSGKQGEISNQGKTQADENSNLSSIESPEVITRRKSKEIEPTLNPMIIAVASQAMAERVTEVEWKDKELARRMRQLPEDRTLPDFRETLSRIRLLQNIINENERPVIKTLLDAMNRVVDYPTHYPMDLVTQQEYDVEVREYFAQLLSEAKKFYFTEPAKAEFFRAAVDFGLELWKEVRLGISRAEETAETEEKTPNRHHKSVEEKE